MALVWSTYTSAMQTMSTEDRVIDGRPNVIICSPISYPNGIRSTVVPEVRTGHISQYPSPSLEYHARQIRSIWVTILSQSIQGMILLDAISLLCLWSTVQVFSFYQIMVYMGAAEAYRIQARAIRILFGIFNKLHLPFNVIDIVDHSFRQGKHFGFTLVQISFTFLVNKNNVIVHFPIKESWLHSPNELTK